MGKDGVARFAYDQVTEDDKQNLANYLESLQQVKVSKLDRDQQFAFWVNLYNSLTLKVVLDYFPVNTIREINISPGFLSTGPWGAKLITIEGFDLSLDDIEHGILRPIWKDPRIHYVVNCASLGCPNLPATAIDPKKLDETLDQAASDFINHPRAVRIVDGDVIVSSIYSWFSEDFGNSDQSILNHMIKYAKEPLKTQLSSRNTISDHSYGWQLNK
ncbi:DUF547 domain-containing protein [Sneathiella limimaris]|uniref:DUF547 domain-containing protein n=1 Tax=Sneathiella limimaris TaxID=1964213 RepID=UPI001469F80D|nr:DUF547 domain-containing protein [Sneathiella limimaris]